MAMTSSKEQKTKPTLPVRQLCILAIVRIAEPLALTSVFPYLPEMIKSFGVPRDEIAKWAGFTSAIFSISQSLTAVLWGRTSDTIGRKPTLILGMICTMFCFLFWGTSTSLAMAITVRAIQGCGNGNVGIIRTVVAELVPEKSLQPVAFSIMPMVWSVGSVFGPAFGGFFARPAQQFPSLFGNNKLFIKFPFLLPNLIAGVFFLCSLVTAVLFLRETLASKQHRPDWGLQLGQKLVGYFSGGKKSKGNLHRARRAIRDRTYADDEASAPLLSTPIMDPDDTEISPDGLTPPTPTAPSSRLAKGVSTPPANTRIFNHQTNMALLSYTMLAMHSTAFDQVIPVFLNHPRQVPDETNTKLPFKFSGGFEMSSGHIGTMFTITALVSALAQFIVFPPLCSRFGELRCYRFACIVLPVVYFLTPYTVLVPNERLRFLAFMLVFVAKGSLGIVTFPCITIILTNSAPSLAVLGTLNGIATTASGVGRAVGPAMAGASFTWGVRHGYIITGWWFLACIASIGAVTPFFMTQGAGFKRTSENGDDADRRSPEELEENIEDGDDSNTDAYDYSDADFEEELLPEIGEDEEQTDLIVGNKMARPETPTPSFLQRPQLPRLQSSAVAQQAQIPEPDEPEIYTADGACLADVDISAPTTPRTGRFRSVSNLSRIAAKDTARDEDVPLSPVVDRK
ncbi:major facilitator superfamily transporter [Grosmannia clavigera kw1407]|uniref:Major facilitator superfamily transporter n=1 Tax=Grosmannia clavigera (strain kw1407 / UAMH 11150) TaxID=655863 RepID=F0XT20_GROCL|nr:major facilitator superfamily transporter [Grosmannia clavigera kw1407]EFW99282.1 major facilitator superfamily transporter [Grosmannia clavigera kw1407]